MPSQPVQQESVRFLALFVQIDSLVDETVLFSKPEFQPNSYQLDSRFSAVLFFFAVWWWASALTKGKLYRETVDIIMD